jgi:tRNA(Ile)-lysidine synthase TilS/MesJ
MDHTASGFIKQGEKCSFCSTEYSEKVELEKKPKADGSIDCIIGISGGVDSCYTLVRAVEQGWKPLVFHYDNGWNSNLSVTNIEKIIKKLDLKLNTCQTQTSCNCLVSLLSNLM